MSDLHAALTALLDRELAEHEEAAARSARADVRCLDCNLRYDERKEYGCVIDGTAHSYDEDELNEVAEQARQEPREYVTLSVAEVRALLAEHPPAGAVGCRGPMSRKRTRPRCAPPSVSHCR